MKTHLAIAAYVLGAIVAFGHASNHVQPDPQIGRLANREIHRNLTVVVSAAFWPLYVSSVLFEETPK